MRTTRWLVSVCVLVMLMGLSVPAQAQCVTLDAPPDQTWNCIGVDGDGVDVAGGNDDVFINGPVQDTVFSTGTLLRVFVVAPDGSLHATDYAIRLDGAGDIVLEGNASSDQYVIYLNGSGDVTSTGNLTGGINGIYIIEVGNVVNNGDINAGTNGIMIQNTADAAISSSITSTGNITASTGDGLSIIGSGGGNITSQGIINAGGYAIYIAADGNVVNNGSVTGSSGIFVGGDGNVTSTGNVIGNAGTGIFIGGSGNVTSDGNITGANGYGIYVGGSGDVTSDGDIFANLAGIYAQAGDVNSVGNITATTGDGIVANNGNVNSTGNITAVLGDGIIATLGNVNSTGDINVGQNGIINAIGDIRSQGAITAGQNGIINAIGDIHSQGDIVAGQNGIVLAIGNIDSQGNITATQTGIINAIGNINSQGDIVAGENGIINAIGNIRSQGNITAVQSGIVVALGNVESQGDIEVNQYGIHVTGSGNVTNNGDITANQYGIVVAGNGNITSDGHVNAGINGIILEGDGEIEVDGIVQASNTGILGGAGDQLVVIDAVVGGPVAAVNTGDGNDRVNLESGAEILNIILMGSGDDTVQIEAGARADATIDGESHDSGDTLIVGDESICKEESGSLDTYTSNSALVDSINLSGDTFNYEGNEYTIQNFEFGENGIERRTCYPKIEDGRINPYDIGAWVAGYCNVQEGVNLWSIDLEGNGQADVSASGAQMRAALEQAVNSGSDVMIAAGPRGTSLWALAWNQYRFVGPDMREPGKTYVFTFAPGTCGMGNSLES